MFRLPSPAGDTAQHAMEEVSSISNFPSDVLSLIFQYACPGPIFDGRYYRPDTDVLQSLSLVSKHWHRTSMATSELWTSICMPMEGNDTSASAAGLASFFGRTSHRSLSVSLDFSGLSDIDDSILLHPSVDATISKNLERIENLVLVKPPRAWFSLLHHLNRMDHLSLYLIQGDAPHISFDDFPSLSKFTLVDGDIRLSMASSCLVTSLTLIGVPLHTCFHIIANCGKLTRLHLEDYNDSGQQRMDGTSLVIPVERFETQRLEMLVWKVFSTGSFAAPWQRALLECINASSLQTLVWHQPPSSALRIWPEGIILRSTIDRFLSRLSPALTCLEFVGSAENGLWHESLFMGQLYAAPNLDSLKLSECNVQFIISVLLYFTLPNVFPKLRTATLGKVMWSDLRQPGLDAERFEENLSDRILQGLELLLGMAERQELALYLEDDSLFWGEDGSNHWWLDRIKSDVMELIKGREHQLNIFVASKPVDWLS